MIANRVRPLTANIGSASAVAEFGMLLRGSDHRGRANYEAAVARARQFRGADAERYRAEFVRLAGLAAGLSRLSRHDGPQQSAR